MLEKQSLDKSNELTNEYIYDWALKLSGAALEKQIPLKLLGATAFIYRCPKHRDLYWKFSRRLTDVDVMTYSSINSEDVDGLLNDLGFEKQQNYIWHASTRDLFINGDGLLIDVFRDKLEFCHTVNFKNRLDTDLPTIPLEEMMLQKLQIMEINDKDFKDLCILLMEYEIGDGASDKIDGSFLASLFSKNWGFYYTATNNLKKLKEYLVEIPLITEDDRRTVRRKVDQLLDLIEAAPKSLAWKMRSTIGTRLRWYKEVEDIER